MKIERIIGFAEVSVNKSKMEHIKIPLPPKEEQARIIVAIDNLFNALDAVKENL